MGWFRIEASYFTAGGELDRNGLVHRAAPIIGYMHGWTARSVKDYCSRKGFGVSFYDV